MQGGEVGDEMDVKEKREIYGGFLKSCVGREGSDRKKVEGRVNGCLFVQHD